MESGIPENTDEERLLVLARHGATTVGTRKEAVTIGVDVFFSTLSQTVAAPSRRRFADYLIALEKFKQVYPEYAAHTSIERNLYKPVLSNRLSLWLEKGEKSTPEQDAEWLLEEERIYAAMRSMYQE